MRRWVWATLIAFAVALAIAVDALVFPSPSSSRGRQLEMTADSVVGLSPLLRIGAPFEESVTITEGGKRYPLMQTGAYVRSRKVLVTIDLYEIASYAESPPEGTTDQMLESLWRDDGRKAYVLRFLKPLPGWELRKAVRDEMARSFGDVSMDDHRDDLDRLLKAFDAGARSGEVFYLVRLTGNRVYFGMGAEKNLALATSSPELARAIWRMWAGPTAEPGRAGLVERLTKPSTRS